MSEQWEVIQILFSHPFVQFLLGCVIGACIVLAWSSFLED